MIRREIFSPTLLTSGLKIILVEGLDKGVFGSLDKVIRITG